MLVWMDLEMTGLDPSVHVIVEIATLVTDDDLNIVAEGPDLVVHQPPEALAGMDDVVVQTMHTKSGLFIAIAASTITLAEAGAQTLAFIQEHVPEARTVPLCGNSIGTDRRFLAAYLPEIEEYLHYRSIDVSTIKELTRRWYPDVLRNAPRKATSHRALDDIRESVAELQYYRQHVFRPRCRTTRTDLPSGLDRALLTERSSNVARVTAPTKPVRQEQEPAQPEITEVAPGVLRLQLPISMPGLGHVNCYALEDERGFAVVDPGLPGPDSWSALEGRLAAAGIPMRRVHSIVVTHSHPDHYGGAQHLRRASGADIVGHESFRSWWDSGDERELEAKPLPGVNPDTGVPITLGGRHGAMGQRVPAATESTP